MKTIKQNYVIQAPIDEVWNAFVNPNDIDDWGGGPAEMDDQAGTEFKLWGGDIWGKNITVEPRRKLVQEWYSGDWPEPSIVTITFSGGSGKTMVNLLHESVPDNEAKEVEDGWKRYYLGPMKEMLEM